jgi:hypothetical protein
VPRPYRKRLTIDMPKDLHKELKEMCKLYNITLTKMVLRLIKQRLILQKQYENS